MNRRDLLLQQMGITQWQLKHPESLKGVVNIVVGEHIRLIIVCDSEIASSSALLKDVLRSLSLNEQEYLCVDFQQAQHLKPTQKLNYWLLSENHEKIDRTLALCQQANSIWQTTDWQQFKQDHQAKRQLWQQIQASPQC
ncbi:TPA: DNA polymerase III subunit psi [Pasteurella multocida]|nr:DNA polymerase III subunit psi [Pasteurella multocida]